MSVCVRPGRPVFVAHVKLCGIETIPAVSIRGGDSRAIKNDITN